MEARSLSNQQAIEQALGKLVVDDGFRDAFFVDPALASEAAGIPLTDRERSALARIRPGALAAFQRYLNAKCIGDCRGTQGRMSRTRTTLVEREANQFP